MMDEKVTLPANHKRSLSVTAKHIAKGIEEIESLLLSHKPDDLIVKVVKNLEEKQRSAILGLTEVLKKENERMIKDFNLKLEKLYEDRIVRGHISHLWVILSESTSKGLRGYGALPINQAKLLDSYINNLLDIIDKMQSVIK